MKNNRFKILNLILIMALFFVSCHDEVLKSDYDYVQNPTNIPTNVTTGEVQNVDVVSATVSGTVPADPKLQDWGVIYYPVGQESNMSVASAKDTLNNYSFTLDLSGLVPNTEYKVKTFAMNVDGLGYGQEMTFKTKPAGTLPFSIKYTDPLSKWQETKFVTIDADGDGYNWGLFYIDNGKTMIGYRSFSWYNEALEPENYLILPPLKLGTSNAAISLSAFPGDPDYYEESFKVVISTAPILNSISAKAAKVIGTHKFADENAVTKTFAIPSEYNGKVVWLGIAHYDSSDMYYMAVASIEVK